MSIDKLHDYSMAVEVDRFWDRITIVMKCLEITKKYLSYISCKFIWEPLIKKTCTSWRRVLLKITNILVTVFYLIENKKENINKKNMCRIFVCL